MEQRTWIRLRSRELRRTKQWDNANKTFQTRKQSFFAWFCLVVVVCAFGGSFFIFNNSVKSATPPTIITYQGKLLESSASVTTTKAMSFLLYDALTSGNLLYTASGTLPATSTINVTPTNGVFSVNLGDTGTNSLDPTIFQNNSSVYLEIWVGGTKLTPRKQMTVTPYSFNSKYLDGIATTSTASTSTYIPVSASDGSFTFNTTTINKTLSVDSGVLYVDPTNNRVGINTTSPQYDLTVNGQSYFTGTSTLTNWMDLQGKVGSPVHKGAYSSGTVLNGAYDVFVTGNYAYVASYLGDNLEIIDISDPSNPAHKGSLFKAGGGPPYLDEASSVYVSGNYAYVAMSRESALEIVDISNPTSPTHTGSYTPSVVSGSTDIKDVFVSGNYAYITFNSTDKFQIVDISNPTNPVFKGTLADGVGSAPYLNGANSVFIFGDYAYIASYDSDALEIIDISNPANPVHKSSFVSSTALNGAQSVFISGNYAYVASKLNRSLEIIDISDPASPTYKGEMSFADEGNVWAMSVFVSGNYAYVTTDRDRSALQIIDVSNPASPVRKGSISSGAGGAMLGFPNSVFVSGNYAYIASTDSDALEIIDVSGLTVSNADIGTAKISNMQVMANAMFDQGVNIRGGLNVGSSGLLLSGDLGISAPTSTNVTTATNTISFSHTVLFKSSATTTEDSLFVFDTANTITNGNLITINNNGSAKFVVDESGNVGINSSTPNYALSVNGTSYITGTSTIMNNFFVGAESENITTSTFVMNGNDAYFADLLGVGNNLFVENNLYIGTSTLALNGSVAGGSITMTGGTLTIDSSGALSLNTTNNQAVSLGAGLFTVNGTSTLVTTTVSGSLNVDSGTFYVDPTNNRVGINTTSPQYDLTVNGQSYFTGTSTLTNWMDLQGKVGSPVHKGSYTSSTPLTGVNDVFVSGNYAYAVGSSFFSIIDVSNPAIPDYKSSLSMSNINGVAVSGNYAYVVVSGALKVIDISNASDPLLVGSIADGINGAKLAETTDVFISGNYAYVSTNGDYSLEIVDISNPSNPTHKGVFTSSTVLTGGSEVFVSGNYAYVASITSDVLEIIDVSNPVSPTHKGSISNGSGGASLDGARSVFVSGNYAYVASSASNTLEIVDISNPASPSHKGLVAHGTGGALLSSPQSVFVSGNYAYVVSPASLSLEIVDISNPSSPVHKGSITNRADGSYFAFLNSVYVSGNYVYITDRTTKSLEIIDVSGLTVSNADIGTAKISNMQVMANALFDQGVNIRGGLNVGSGGILLSGDFGISAPTSTDVTTATNTISFSHTVLFKSSATTTETNAFIFDTVNSFEGAASSTQYLLSVRENGVSKFSVSANGDARVSGTIYSASTTVGTPGAPGDLAERVDISIDDSVEPGDVMMVDANSPDTYRRSNFAYEPAVSGVISTNPTITVGNGKTTSTAVMALVGRVPVKVIDENGPIQRGDLLVSASTTGYAMRYDPNIDTGTKAVGIIGVALDNLSEGQGKIMALIRTGWINNRSQTIAQIQQNLSQLAETAGTNLNANPVELTVSQNLGGQITVGSSDLNLGGYKLLNVASLMGKDNKWEIDNIGRFTVKFNTVNGVSSLYLMQSQSNEYIISGTDKLENGEKKIVFSQADQEIVDPDQPINVSVALTSDALGVYVIDKSATGFTVKELKNGTSEATFDWVVVAVRRQTDMTQIVTD